MIREANLRAIALMCLAMASFAASDMGIKLAAATLPVGQILLLMSAIGTPIFAVLARRAGQRLAAPVFWAPAVLVRNCCEVVGSVSISLAVALAPLSLVTAITQALPLVVTLGAALFLGERVGPLRWGAVAVGLCGVLVILRPDASGLPAGAWFAVLATLGLAGRDLATRRVPRAATTLQLATYGFGFVGVSGAAMLVAGPGWVAPGPAALAFVVLAALTAMLAYFAITTSVRLAEISVVAPFRYTRLIFGVALGVAVFGERVDAWVYAGSALVIGSGLFVLLRERHLARRAAGAEVPR